MSVRHVRVAAALVLGGSALGCVASLASQHGSHRADTVVQADAVSQSGAAIRTTNLRVLPKDISAAELDGLMHRYDEELGVSCGYCHAENPQNGKINYASDENPRKETARLMIAMLRDINTKYLAQLGDPSYPVAVTCGNCHQGQTNPPDFDSSAAAAVSER